MNSRERFIEVMNFNTSVRSLKWKFGFWGETLNRWYSQGLPRKHYPVIETNVSTPTSTLYTFAWSDIPLGKRRIDEILKPVEAVLKTGGCVPFGRPLDTASRGLRELQLLSHPAERPVRHAFGLDQGRCCPRTSDGRTMLAPTSGRTGGEKA